MIKQLYLALRNLLIACLTIIMLSLVFLSQKNILPYLAQTYLKDYGVDYTSIEGSIIDGFIIKNIAYKDSVKIKTLEARYNLLSFIRLTPKIELIKLDELHVDLDKIQTSNESNSSLEIINFQIAHLILKDATLKDKSNEVKLSIETEKFVYKSSIGVEKLKTKGTLKSKEYGEYKVDLNGSKITLKDEDLDIRSFDIVLQSPYGTVQSKNANLTKGRLEAITKVDLTKNISEYYTSVVKGIPETLELDLNASMNEIEVKTMLKNITLKSDENLSLVNSVLHVKYFIQNNYFEADSTYTLSYNNFKALIEQKALFSSNFQFQSNLKSTILQSPIELPNNKIDAVLNGDDKFLIVDMNTSQITAVAKTFDYKQFSIDIKANTLPLNFLKKIPDSLKDDTVTVSGNLVLDVAPLFLRGEVKVEDNYIKTHNHIEIKKHSLLAKGGVQAKKESKIYTTLELDLVSNLNFIYFNDISNNMLNIDSKQANITIFENNHSLEGWGNFNENNFKIEGNIAKKNRNDIKFSATFPSIKTLFQELKINTDSTNISYDAQVDINAIIDFNDQLELSTTISLPWFYIQPDKENTYAGQNAKFEIIKEHDKFIIESYSLDFMNHNINSKKQSIISLENNDSITIEEFWVYDNLLIDGKISTKDKNVKLSIKSDKFTYEGKEGNLSAKANITVNIDKDTEEIEGYITLLNGVINHIPAKDYSELDDDIIIIQNIDDKSINNRFINVHIDSKKPIKYKIDNVNIDFIPDFSVFKNRGEKIVLLGLVTIDKGEVTAIDKTFKFQKSEIYLHDINTNPNIHLNITYQTLDYIDIDIFASGRLETPVIILSSKPTMSQNDIMSYILFGEPASSSTMDTSNSGGGDKIYLSSFLVGSSVKSILNQSDAFKVDSINILTNDEGSLGYEIGSRINKDLRVIYKNNVISSIVVQYNINRAIRVDVDVDQDNRGVSLVYVKDF